MTTNTAIQSREIRVFLSSTFRDMDAERTYLVKQVFPKVRAVCLERQVGFSEIDLRWGVSEEESKNGATVEICLKEIDRCRGFPPFFIGFLGERYGWIPKHDELAAYWEQHSDSHYAPAIRDSIERGISVTELEMELAVLGAGAAEKIDNHALFCLRDAGLTDTLYAESKAGNPNAHEVDFYDAGQSKLGELKRKIGQSGFLGLDNYTSVEQFGAAVEIYLLAQLDHYFPADEVPTALQRSNAAHAGFRFQRLQNFLPRTDVRYQMIAAIEQRIEAPSHGPIVITGPSGQGKSALMADLARHYQTNFAKDWRVFDHYIGADNANHLDGWVDRILQTLHPEIHDISGNIPESKKDKIEALSTWISMAARRNNCRYLFVLDALDQLSDGGKNLDILTPQTLGPDGILIVSAADNTPAWTSTANWQTLIEVPSLTNELRIQLVTDTLSRYRKTLPDDLTSQLASANQSGSPLFLSLALEELRVDARHENIAKITDEILKQPDAEQLFLNRFLLDADNARPEQPDLAVKFMALISAARAGLSEKELADLLAMPCDPISEDTGKPRMPQIHLSKLLNNFAPFLLNKEGRRVPMHRIFGDSAITYYGTASVREQLYAHFAPGYGRGENEFNARGTAEALHQITELAKLEYTNQKHAKKRLIEDLGYITIPVKIHDDEPNNGEQLVLSAVDSLTASDKNMLQKRWVELINKLDIDGVKKEGGSIRNFGDWLEYWAQYPLAQCVLAILITKLEQFLLPEHLDIAICSNSLGTIYLKIAKFDEAIVWLRRAFSIREKSLGVKHIDTITSINNLAVLLYEQGDYAAAEELFQQALTITEKSLGADNPSTAMSLNNVGVLYKAQGNLAAAETMYQRALSIREKILGSVHPDTAQSLHNLAHLLNDKKDYLSAEPLYRRALEIRLKTFGDNHPITANSLNNLALLLYNIGNNDNAEPLYRKAITIQEMTFGKIHPETATSYFNLALLLFSKGDVDDADYYFRRSLDSFEQTLGLFHNDTIQVLQNFAIFLRETDKLSKAEPLQRDSVARHIHAYGENGLETAAAYNGLGLLLKLKGELDEAEINYRKALDIRERELGADTESTMLVRNRLEELLELQKIGEK